jgi:hypothetical protein
MHPYKHQDKKNWKQHSNSDVRFFVDNWFLALILICLILGADAFSEWGALAIETFFTWIGVL